MALALDKTDAIHAGALFLLVVALTRRYRISWDTVLPWLLGGLVVAGRWYLQRQTTGSFFERVMHEYRQLQCRLDLRLPYLYREPDWISALHVGLQTFPDPGVAYFRPVAQNLDNIARILYYSENALGFDPIEWSVARMHAGQALNHLLGLQYRVDVGTAPERSLYAMTAYFRQAFVERIPGFQPELVQPVLSHAAPHANREWYPEMQ